MRTAIAIGAILLFGSRPVPEALKYIPADAAVVVELRPELPGDQLQKLGNLLAHVRLLGLRDGSLDADALVGAILEGYGPDTVLLRRLPAYRAAAEVRLACVYAFRPPWWHLCEAFCDAVIDQEHSPD